MNQNSNPDPGISTYDSPLEPLGLDCAYAGRVSSKNGAIFPVWEDIEFDTLVDQISWTTKHSRVRGRPECGFKAYLNRAKKANKARKRKEKPDESNNKKKKLEEDPLYPLINSLDRVFLDKPWEKFFCTFHLLVTEFGWIFHLFQCFGDDKSLARTRVMTLHCNFERDIVFREITETETQYASLNEGVRISPLYQNKNNGMRLHFHEAKQFSIRGSNALLSQRFRYSSSTSGDLKKVYGRGGFLFANCGTPVVKIIEGISGTRIELIPAFQHPQDQYFASYPGASSMRRAYISGQEMDVELARACVHEQLMMAESKIEKRSGISDDVLSSVADLFSW